MNRARSMVAALVVALSLLGAAPAARASVVLETSVGDMTRVSALVVRGEVLSLDEHRVPGTRAKIVTDVRLRVDEVLKGALPKRADTKPGELTLTLPGGRAGDYVMRIPGMPRFRVGEQVVLFLEQTRAGYAISGLQQGRFVVVEEPISGLKVALRRYDGGLSLARRDANGALVIAQPDQGMDLRTLDELRAQVRAVVEAPAAP